MVYWFGYINFTRTTIETSVCLVIGISYQVSDVSRWLKAKI